MERFRNFVFLALLVLLFTEVLIVFPNQVATHKDNDPKPPSTQPLDPKQVTAGPAEQKMQGVHLVESQKGSRDWELFAQDAEGNEGKGTWNLSQVKVLFYNKDQIEFTVVGKKGAVDTKTKNMKISGEVTTTSNNGYTFRTEEVEYDATVRRIQSPSHVSMRGPRDKDGDGMKVDGDKMLVEVEQSKMTISSNVTASKDLQGNRRMRLTSTTAEFSGKNKQAHFLGNVVMQYDRVKLEAPSATFFSGEKADFLSNVKFAGGIKVSDADKFATSENLDLDLLANRFVFTGRPKVYQNNDELSGEQIIFLEGGKKVKVEKVRAQMEEREQKK